MQPFEYSGPLLPDPPELNAGVTLLPYQKQGHSWMVGQEKPSLSPPCPRGGLLADEMGMGKTLQVRG